jgi:hypothetical protein
VPSVVAPSLNVTVPVGVPAVDVTVAVNVTLLPKCAGFADGVSVVDVVAVLIVSASAADVLAAKSTVLV